MSEELVTRLSRLGTGQLSDVLDEAGLPNQVLSSKLFGLSPDRSFAGRAACFYGHATIRAQHARPDIKSFAFERCTGPGTIVVLATEGFNDGAVIGGLISRSLQNLGATGFITDGAVRDADEIRSLGFPVICSNVTPVNSSRRWSLVAYDVPVSLPGPAGTRVAVAPNDLILADADGVVVIPAQWATQIIEDTEKLWEIEGEIDAELKAGEGREKAFANHPRFKHVRSTLG